MSRDVYQEPLVSRYTSKDMQQLFSETKKFTTWRKCWIALAEAQYELGLTDLVTLEMLEEMRANWDNIDYDIATAKEREIRHDVMAHVYEFGLKCPKASAIIHLGATSQFVVCNTDLLIQREAFALVKKALLQVIKNLADFRQGPQPSADAWLYPLPTRPASDRRKAKYLVYPGSYNGS